MRRLYRTRVWYIIKKIIAVRVFYIVPALLLVLSPAYKSTIIAQDGETDLYVLDEIVVTGSSIPQYLSRLGQSLSVIGREEIKALAANSIPDILKIISGVDVRQRGVHGLQADVSIRGSSFEQTLILVDGFNVSDSQTGHHNMDLPVNLEDIERIEILKGPGARVYGHNAMAGVINIITRDVDQNAVGGQVKYGDFDFYGLEGNITGRTGPVSHRMSVSTYASTGHIEKEDTDFDVVTLAYKSNLKGDNHMFQLGLGYTEKDFGAYRFYSDTFPNQRERTASLLLYGNARFKMADMDIMPRIFWRRHDDDFKIEIGGLWYQNKHTTDSYGVQIGSRYESTLGTTAIGGEITLEDLESTNLGDHDRQRHGIFLEHRFYPTDRLVIGLGASAMKYSDWDWEYWPGVDINIKLPGGFNCFASLAKSFRTPTYTELYYNTPANQGNPDLKPERAWTYETGMRWFERSISANASLFYRDSENIIDWSRASKQEPWKVRNIAESRIRGFELGVDLYPSFVFNNSRDMMLNFSYTYLDSDRTTGGFESKYVMDHMQHQLNGLILINWLDVLTQSVHARYEKRLNGDSYFIVDSRLTYRWNQYELFLDVTNMFDKEYVDAGFAPAAGRWIIGGIRFNREL